VCFKLHVLKLTQWILHFLKKVKCKFDKNIAKHITNDFDYSFLRYDYEYNIEKLWN